MIQHSLPYRSGGNRDRLNPYRIAASILLRRLKWDLNPKSWRHRRKLAGIRNKYCGQKAVILCNGPSLNDIDLSEIKHVFSFGLNKINLLFENSHFRPSCIVAVNSLIIKQNSSFFSQTNIPLFLNRSSSRFLSMNQNNLHLLDSCDFPFFSRDCSLSFFQGFTVTYTALQLAYHMGFSNVALVGCDHDYLNDGSPNSIVQNPGKDKAHFSEDYFLPDDEWEFPDLKASELYYDVAKRCFEEDGRRILNASTKSKLKIFPRISLKDFIHDG